MMVDCNTPLRSRVLKEYPGVRLYFLSILSQIIPVENNLKQLLWEQIKKHKGKKWFLDFLFFGHTLSDIMQKNLQNDYSFFNRYQICDGTSQTNDTKNQYINKGEQQKLKESPQIKLKKEWSDRGSTWLEENRLTKINSFERRVIWIAWEEKILWFDVTMHNTMRMTRFDNRDNHLNSSRRLPFTIMPSFSNTIEEFPTFT